MSEIKIIEGDNFNKKHILFKIENEKKKMKKLILTPLELSTITICAQFSNIVFHEKDILNKIKNIPHKYNNILRIYCNYGEIRGEKYVEKEKKKKSNRGRKPIIRNKKRKINGLGKFKGTCFASQITFEIKNMNCHDARDIYKIKLFRNGKIQIPGGVKQDMSDIKPMIIYVHNFVKDKLKIDSKILFIEKAMINYKCKLIDDNLRIKISELKKYIITKYKHHINPKVSNHLKLLNKNWANYLHSALIQSNPSNMAELMYDSPLLIKFYFPFNDKLLRKITIKILISGKINIDGGNSELYNIYLYYVINNILNESYKYINNGGNNNNNMNSIFIKNINYI